ncbi:hypothetical protein FM038_020885 [Shewanella eurypsychrophilus]|uniref:MazG-related protein n=1 Tax=Shewanella eurypsychrophilus TaxID=2593656 RepID=A0ABX6VDA7_9GAMM|nr:MULTISPECIES: MazG-related protein [Shewanella]QFU24361.1 MazG-related protein [Shewanella sp. YLB-09]QPG59561.1 hypothetical protein FM038_020885 [Shewanella eurypsychrophilus]
MNWIVDFLESESIPYFMIGGIAAIAYGAKREIYDIDLTVRQRDIEKIAKFGKDYLTFGPQRYKDNEWDVVGLQLIYQGIKIEFNTDETPKIYSQKQSRWIELSPDFSASCRRQAFGRELSVIPISELTQYKAHLAREVDLEDIALLSKTP